MWAGRSVCDSYIKFIYQPKRYSYGYKDNIRMDLKATEYVSANWIRQV